MKKIRLIENFSGYSSQALALKYLGVEFEHYKTCEWAVKSIQATKDLHFGDDDTDYSKGKTKEELIEWLYKKGISADYNKPMFLSQIKRLGEQKIRTIYNNIKATHNLVNISQVKGKDLGIENRDKYTYIVTYSYPCQDLSLAGKGAGMKKGSGTRSGLLWEFERIMRECKELNTLPDILLMENVPQVHSKKNIEDFNLWIESLNELGYKSVYKDLNTKNFKVPQNRNRCFMVSILDKKQKFKMPEDIGLTLRLKDVLEKNVDEKYYLSDKMLTYVSSTNEWYSGNRTNCKINKNPASTITTRETNGRADCSNYVSQDLEEENINLRQLGQLYPNTGNPQAGRIYDKDGLSPCLDTFEGGNRMPKIGEDLLKREVANKCLENKLVEPNDIIDISYSKSRLKEMEEGYIQKKNTEDNQCANTLTTASNNMGVCVDETNKIIELNKNGKHQQDLIQSSEGISRCICCGTHASGPHLLKTMVEEITEPLGCASRGRNPENPSSRKSGEKTEQRIEINKSGCSNCLTTVQKDTYVIEPNILSQKRNEYGKAIRKQYENGEIKEQRKNMVDLVPREDGISNTITTFIKDNYLAEPNNNPPSNK